MVLLYCLAPREIHTAVQVGPEELRLSRQPLCSEPADPGRQESRRC